MDAHKYHLTLGWDLLVNVHGERMLAAVSVHTAGVTGVVGSWWGVMMTQPSLDAEATRNEASIACPGKVGCAQAPGVTDVGDEAVSATMQADTVAEAVLLAVRK